MRGRGMDFGPAFLTVRELWTSPAEAIVRLGADVPRSSREAVPIASTRPSSMDVSRSIGAALPEGNDDLYLPARLERFQIYRRASGNLWAHAVRRTGQAQNTTTFDIRVWDQDGPIAHARGMEFIRVAARRQIPIFEVRWKARASLLCTHPSYRRLADPGGSGWPRRQAGRTAIGSRRQSRTVQDDGAG